MKTLIELRIFYFDTVKTRKIGSPSPLRIVAMIHPTVAQNNEFVREGNKQQKRGPT